MRMATALKDSFDRPMIQSIAKELAAAYPALDQRAFVRESVKGLSELSLTERGHRVAQVMRARLPNDFERAAEIIVASLGPEQDHVDGAVMGMAVFRYMPAVFYVGRYGLEHFEASMVAQRELTKRFSAEWSIRFFLIEHPEATYEQLQAWTAHKNRHVRRLVSEGTRPLLPWAPRLRAFQKDPEPVIALLERLRDDDEPYVQRSVGNNLNDISKDHPDRIAKLAKAWLSGASKNRRWVVERGLRTLVKKSHRGALSALGFAGRPKVQVEDVRVPKRHRLGEVLRFSFSVRSAAAQTLLVDYAMHFCKANGKTAPKVFKLKRVQLRAKETVTLEGRVSFKELSTRRHYAGLHRLEAVINGVPFALGECKVVA